MTESCGTITGYYGNGCRCADCREAARLYYYKAASEPRKPCNAPECDRPARVRGRYCDGHLRQIRVYGELRADIPLKLPNGSDKAGYEAAHKRVSRARGKAREHGCAHCPQPATNWAFMHGSSGELPAGTQRNGRPHGPYSLDVNDYIPLCQTCHRRYDVGMSIVSKRARDLAGAL